MLFDFKKTAVEHTNIENISTKQKRNYFRF
jgi:hypothetical protein